MNLALFDFDGTITVSDTFTDFLRFATHPRRIAVGGVLLGPVGIGYRCGLISAATARPVYSRYAFRGERASAVRKLGRRYAADVLPPRLRRRALDRIHWHQQQGDTVVVVSASLDVYLRPLCRELGVRVICSELEERGGRLTGRYVHGDCSGAGKARRILAELEIDRYPVVYGYGDTAEDLEMLALAHRRYYRWREVTEGR
jgi:phosphatidylglycerophosphatase C